MASLQGLRSLPKSQTESDLRQMATKFKPPFKRKAEPEGQTTDKSVGQSKAMKTKMKKKSVEPIPSKLKKSDTKTNRNEFVFSVANGNESSVNIKHIQKMSKKFGVVDGKGLDAIDDEDDNNQLVPQSALTETDTTDNCPTVPEARTQYNYTVKDLMLEDFLADDEFFDPN